MSAMNADERRLELERKKQKLAEIRQQKRRMEEDRRRQLLTPTRQENGGDNATRQTLTSEDLSDILVEIGINPMPQLQRTPPKNEHLQENGGVSPRGQQRMSGGARLISLDFTQPQTVTVAQRDNASYSKNTQTDDEKFSVGEFSTGSQEFDYDDDLGIDKHHGMMHDFDGSPTGDDLAAYLPYSFGGANRAAGHHESDDKTKEAAAAAAETAPVKLPDLSEEEKAQVLSSQRFQQFFDYAAKVVERALAEEVDIFVNYAADGPSVDAVSGERLEHTRTFEDEKWTRGRAVVGISISELHPELVAVAYDHIPEVSSEPTGVVVVWNTKFKKNAPEYVFYCQSRLTSVAFARFHPHLLIGGCYSGQLVLWDNRGGVGKKTPCNKSPLSLSAHTHPVYALAVVGSHNAHNVVSISTDGRLCAWNIETLTTPVECKELLGKQGKQLAVLSMAFPPNDVNNVVVAGEDGSAYFVSRHGTSSADKGFEGHSAPVSSISFHPANGPVDFSHLFFTSSFDWTIKLWSLKEPNNRFLCSLEAHFDEVFDVLWSPVHPAVFASADVAGNLFLWNLNEDVEGPVCRLQIGEELFLRKISWSSNGQHLLVGNSEGQVWLYDVHDSLHSNIRNEEYATLVRVLADLKASMEEADELGDAGGILAGGGSARGVYSSSLAGTAPLSAAGGAMTSPRAVWP